MIITEWHQVEVSYPLDWRHAMKWVTKCAMGWVTNYKAFIETNMTEYFSPVYDLPSHLTLSLNSLKWPGCDNINKITHLT